MCAYFPPTLIFKGHLLQVPSKINFHPNYTVINIIHNRQLNIDIHVFAKIKGHMHVHNTSVYVSAHCILTSCRTMVANDRRHIEDSR